MAVSWDPLLLVDTGTLNILDANAAASHLHGTRREELLGTPLGDMFSDARFIVDIFAAHRDYVPLRYHRRRDGRHVPVEMSIRYLQTETNEIAIVALRDISERIDRERQHSESERKYRSLFEASPYPILIVNPHGVVVDANRCAQVHYGYDHESLIRLSWQDIDLEASPGMFVSRPSMIGVREHLRSDGTRFMAEVMLSYFRLHDQSLVLALVRDVTEHWNTFCALQASEARWRFAIEGAGDALIDWPLDDDDTHYISPMLSQLLGYSPEEDATLDASRWRERVHPDDWRRLEAAIEAHLVGNESLVQIEYRMRDAAGNDRWMTLRAKIIQSGRGRGRLIGAVRDIHKLRMRQFQETADRGRINRLERMATAGEMLSALAHEVNQPLTAVSNYSSLALRQFSAGSDSESISRSLKVISEQALRAGEIVRRIREFVRRSEPNYTLANINQLVPRVVRWCENEASIAEIEIRLELDLAIPDIRLDIMQIEQLLFNLLRNGMESMQEESVLTSRRLVVSTFDDGEAIRVVVRDHGCGIDLAEAEMMFEPFVSSKPEGMGMGLAICRTIVESHGGKIWVELPIGERGTAVSFILPKPQSA